MTAGSLYIFWCPDCDLSYEHDSDMDEDEIGLCPECEAEGELMEEVEDLLAA